MHPRITNGNTRIKLLFFVVLVKQISGAVAWAALFQAPLETVWESFLADVI
jgi:hypothetical protein